MSEIISKDAIRAKARAAFFAGRSRDSHGFNWHAPALATWLEEYDRLDLSANLSAAVEALSGDQTPYVTLQAQAFPQSHAAPATCRHIEREQTA
jgi:hypothetical protein